MDRYWTPNCVVVILIGSLLLASSAASGKNNPAKAPAANAQAEQARQQQIAVQQEQLRKAQEQQALQQQQAARKMQEQEMKAQEEARKSQEQALKAQEEQARKVQEQALRTQQEEAKRIQQQQASVLQRENEQKAQMQQAAIRQEQEGQKARQRAEERVPAELPRAKPGAGSTPAAVAAVAGARIAATRAVQARPLPPEKIVPLSKSMSMPVLEENAAAQDKEHAQAVMQNLQNHLLPVQLGQAPPNVVPTKALWMNNYLNNYWTAINNQRFCINRANTYVNSVLPADYPYWYQPDPGWQFSNGFVLGNIIRANLDWLRWGWHPYYGPQPEGFVCADDFIPTAWMYVPAYGLWMQPGVYGWAPSGPPYDYTGPITVEVLEPRHVHVRDPYTGWERARVINVIYLYNAFFYPEEERWGYVNRHGYFVWLNF